MKKQTIDQKAIYIIDETDYQTIKDSISAVVDKLAEIEKLKNDLSKRLKTVEITVAELSAKLLVTDDLSRLTIGSIENGKFLTDPDGLDKLSADDKSKMADDLLSIADHLLSVKKIVEPDTDTVADLTKLVDLVRQTVSNRSTDLTKIQKLVDKMADRSDEKTTTKKGGW